MEVLVVFSAIIGVLWYVFNDPKKASERKKYPILLVLAMIALIVIPPILTVLIILWNENTVLVSFTKLDLDLFLLRLTVPFEAVAIVTVALAVIFYGYALSTRSSRVYYIGIPLQAISLFIVFLMMSVLPNLQTFAEIEIADTEYMLVQVAPPERGELYLFSCNEDEDCIGANVANISGEPYASAEMAYDAVNSSMVITASNEEVEEQYVVPLPLVATEPTELDESGIDAPDAEATEVDLETGEVDVETGISGTDGEADMSEPEAEVTEDTAG